MRILYATVGGEGGEVKSDPPDLTMKDFEGIEDADWSSVEGGEKEAPVSASEASTTPEEGSSGVEQVATPQEQAKEWQSIREAAKDYGYEFGPEVADDQAALVSILKEVAEAKKLKQQTQQADAYRQLGEQLAPYVEDIQKWRQAQTKAAEEPPSYQPPPYDERWESMVELNRETGLVVGKPGCPPEIVKAVNKRLDWQREYNRDPIGMAIKATEERVTKTVEKIFQEKFDSYQKRQTAQSILDANASWMFKLTPTGEIAMGYDGKEILTPMGRAYGQYVNELQQAGITDPVRLNHYAKSLAATQFTNTQVSKPTPVKPTAQAKNMVGSPNRNALGAQPLFQREENPASPETPYDKIMTTSDFKRAALQAFNEYGITDADIVSNS